MGIPVKKYRLRRARLVLGEMEGWMAAEHGLSLDPALPVHTLFLPPIDSAQEALKWGRLVVDGDFPPGSVQKILWYASDENQFILEKCEKAVNVHDTLLYSQTGRYLWIRLEVLGCGNGILREITVYTPGDLFLNTFPEVYREHGSFLHRYLTVFSTVYLDLQQKIDSLHEYLEPDTAPPRMLCVLAGWLGVEAGEELFDTDTLARLIRELPWLNRHKGTKAAVERIARLVLEEDVMVVERNALQEWTAAEKTVYDRLYGGSCHDFTILIKKERGEAVRSRILCLTDQFKPLHSCMNLVSLTGTSRLDGYCYLGINAALSEKQKGVLDANIPMDGSGCLTEQPANEKGD